MSPDRTHAERALLVVGWREWLSLPELGIAAIRAKIDTGARTSALHVDEYDTFEQDGAEFVRFSIHPGRAEDPSVSHSVARVVDRRGVTDSGGTRSVRIFIRTRLVIGPSEYPIEINLTNRRNMLFPMLLGRTAMNGRLLVDPARSFALGERDLVDLAAPPPIGRP